MVARLGNILAIVVAISASITHAADRMDDTRTQPMNSNIRSLQVKVEGNDYAPPIIELGGSQTINVSFDEMGSDRRYLRFSVIHCTADWLPSQLIESEWTDGFNYSNIDSYNFSAGTFSQYVHYSFSVPNEDINLKISGNYLIVIYDEDEPEQILAQARFMVSEQTADLSATVSSRTDIDFNRTHQQLTIEVNTQGCNVQNPYTDLRVDVTQNERLDNSVTVTAPARVVMGKAIYEHNQALIFPAGNEFRRIETVATTYHTMRVARMEYHHPYYHATLEQDVPRNESPYLYDETQFGRFTIRTAELDDSDTGADYIITHFSLDTGAPITKGRIYIDGEFTGHIFSPQWQMKWDASAGIYRCHAILKQGAYNYQYLFLPDGSNTARTADIEGDKYQTVNEYCIRVYHRRTGERYDRLIGYTVIFSGK